MSLLLRRAATQAVIPPVISANIGDDAGFSKRPIIDYRPKVEKALEQVLELVEDIEPQTRTSVKRAAVKQAREAFKAIEIPANYGPASKAISEALARVSRAAGEYQAFQDAAMRAAMEIEALIAEMERKRRKRRREEEQVILWLLN